VHVFGGSLALADVFGWMPARTEAPAACHQGGPDRKWTGNYWPLLAKAAIRATLATHVVLISIHCGEIQIRFCFLKDFDRLSLAPPVDWEEKYFTHITVI
jgi:hypothetical protein